MEIIVSILEIIGIISFSAAGAMIAIDKENDIFGVVLLSIITCFGGGMLRDVLCGGLIGIKCPWFFSGAFDANLYIIICVLTSATVFLIAMLFKKKYVMEQRSVVAINNILDAIGIGVFSAIGTASYISQGAFVAISMGVISAIGGGIIRDVILSDIPFVLRKYVYAVATIVGASVYYIIAQLVLPDVDFGRPVAIGVCTLVVFVIRMLATYYKWNMPRAIDFSEMKKKPAEQNEENKQTEFFK